MHDIGNRMGFKVNQIGPVHPTVEGGYQAALALEGEGTTAIITYNDLIAVGIVLRFTADGVNVPGDVSVIGFDNTLIAPVVTPPITSIRIPRVQLGQVAVRRLLLMMISPMILLGVFLWIPGMPFGIYVFACWRCTWEMTPETAGFGAHARGEKRDGHVGMAGWLRRARLVLREYASTLRVKEFRKHLAIYLLVQVTMDVFGQTFVFFVVHDWNHTAAFASLLPGCTAVSLPLMPVFGWAMTKIGPKRLYAINFIGWLGTAWLFAAWMLVGTLPEPWWAVFPYIADIDQIVTRRYRSATFSGIQASFRQLGSGIATIAAGLVLGRSASTRRAHGRRRWRALDWEPCCWAGLPSCRRDGHLLDCVRPSRHQQACGRHRIDRDHPPAQRRRQGRRHARNPSCGGTTDRSALRELLAVAGEARPMNGRAAMPCRSLHW